jgi:phosphate-selective porin OprO/OprP
MRARLFGCTVALALAVSPALGIAEGQDEGFKVYWKEGLRMDTADKTLRLKIGGRIFNDWAWFDEDQSIETAFGSSDDGTEFRAARLYISGEVYKHAIFKAEYDFADDTSEFKDVYVGLQDLRWVGTVRVGHFKEPFGLEQLTSSRFITFMERGLPDALVPGRNTGFGINNALLEDRMTVATGVFYNSDDFGDSDGNDNWQWSGRVTGTPLATAPDRLIHLGGAVRVGDPDDNTAAFDSTPESHLANDYLDTGAIADADGTQVTYGAEAAGVFGPFSVQGEYMRTMLDRSGAGNAEFPGWYVFASWFITGEHRAYKASDGVFDRVSPNHNFLSDGGWGAWELAARYSSLDLDDAGVTGGEMDDVTAGVNWYLYPNARVMLNYIYANPESVGDANIFQTRFQVDF